MVRRWNGNDPSLRSKPLTGLRRQKQSLSITHNMSPGRGWNFQQKNCLHFHCKFFFFFKNFAQIIADICTSKNISANIYVRNFFNSKYCRIFCGILSTANIFGNICVKNTIENAVFFQQQILSYFCGILSTANISGNICVQNTVENAVFFSTANIIVFFCGN